VGPVRHWVWLGKQWPHRDKKQVRPDWDDRQDTSPVCNQDVRSYTLARGVEVLETLRDKLRNQNNRFNILILCNTVCQG
jgi:hypothetical protein